MPEIIDGHLKIVADRGKMKNSQKGMKLNEARYFRQPRPYTRKRITKMRLIPDLSGIHGSVNSSPKDRLSLSSYPRSSERSRDRCITLDRDQRSTEIAWISYTSDSENPDDFYLAQGRDRWRDTFVETEPEKEIIVNFPEALDAPPKITEVNQVKEKQEQEKEVQVEFQVQVEETKFERGENLKECKPEVPVKSEVPEKSKDAAKLEDCHEQSESRPNNSTSSDSERSIWWRYGSIRKILDFFGNLLGKRASDEHEKEAPKTTRVPQSLETSLKRSQNTEKKEASPIKSRTKRSSKRKTVATRKNIVIKQPDDDLGVSGLTKQIMSTRDKRLRATLLEHELRTRKLEEENRRYRKILQDKLKTRQMSSPLH